MGSEKNSYVFRRHEIKYMVDSRQRALLEEAIRLHMRPDPHGESTICNVYYDTPDYRLIRASQEKPVYKEKMRLRSYGRIGEDGICFLELKKKYDGIVYKRRIELREAEAVAYLTGRATLPEDSQIGREIDYFRRYYGNLIPAVHLSYDRSAYYSLEDPNLRVTFDRNIRWRRSGLSLTEDPGGAELLDEDHSLMEIKTASAIPLWLVKVLSDGKIRKASFSKYGMAYECILYEQLAARSRTAAARSRVVQEETGRIGFREATGTTDPGSAPLFGRRTAASTKAAWPASN